VRFQPAVRLVFGVGGNALPALHDGWAAAEDGFCWTLGGGASLDVRLPSGEGAVFLELALNPFAYPVGRARRLTVRVNGVVVGEDALVGEGTVGYAVPHGLVPDGGLMEVALLHAPARSPAEVGLSGDTRRLGFMVREVRIMRVAPLPRADATALPPFAVPVPRDDMGRCIVAATGLDPRDLSLCFESLGHNCEFGLMQRQLGAEPLSLLRFAGITLDDLLAGFSAGFAGVGEAVSVSLHPTRSGRHEYLVRDARFGFSLHSFRTAHEVAAEAVVADYANRLRFGRRHLMELLAGGERLFVFQRPGQITRSQALPLLHRLRTFGPNALLYVDQDPHLPPGVVEQVGHGLFHGRLAQMAPAEDVGELDLTGWLGICVNAHRLWSAFRRVAA
jgi:hypothetical protein